MLIQSLEWFFHNFRKLIILHTMQKTTGKIAAATCEILMLGAAMQKCSLKIGV